MSELRCSPDSSSHPPSLAVAVFPLRSSFRETNNQTNGDPLDFLWGRRSGRRCFSVGGDALRVAVTRRGEAAALFVPAACSRAGWKRGVGGGWGACRQPAVSLWAVTRLHGGQVTGRSPFMEVTDVVEDAPRLAWLCHESPPLFSSFLSFFFYFALIKLDFLREENVHLNVSIHISRPPVKYGGIAGII